MFRRIRSVAAGAVVVGALLAGSNTAVEAQQAPAAQIDAAWAEQFHGNWNLAMETPGGPQQQVLSIAPGDNGLTVSLSAGGGGMPAPTFAGVSRNEDTLVARFNLSFDGNDFPMVINIKRDGDALATKWVMGDGAFEMDARGTRQP
jgi:hypothetical protein